jgi:hypothetical protein
VTTTEGYARRPGGSQALFHAECQQLEHEHHVALTDQAFRDYQSGVLPTGPGAKALVEAFSHPENQRTISAAGPPTVVDNERRIENLVRGQAATLHVGPANYCWFRDPAKALCLKLAGTPEAKDPLVNMCDSVRCPQATHHPCHREVWVATVRSHQSLIDGLGPSRASERHRLQAEITRAQRVVDQIDAASTMNTPRAPSEDQH